MGRFRHFLVCTIGRRGATLLFLALLDFVYGISLTAPRPEDLANPTVGYFAGIAPLWVFGCLWIGAGLACLGSAFMRSDRWGFTAAMFIKILWGILFVLGTIQGVPRGYVSAAIWLCFAAFVGILSTWPEPPDIAARECEGEGAQWPPPTPS